MKTDTTGTARFRLDGDELHFTLQIEDGVDILAVAGAHIHCGGPDENGGVTAFLAGAAPPNGFDGDVKISATLNSDSVLDAGCGTNLEELVQSLRDGNTYVNVHSAANPAGEIRGQITQPGR